MNEATTTNVEKREGIVEQPEPTRSGRTYVPAVDILEKQDELLLLADMPGVRPEDIDINYERGELRIVGRVVPRQSPQTSYLLREYGVGDYERAFRVGDGIDADQIAAEVQGGVLTLHLPKSAAARTRKIEVKAG